MEILNIPLTQIRLGKIDGGHLNPRHQGIPVEFASIAKSMATIGQMIPVRVTLTKTEPNPEYTLTDGERRFKAAQSLKWESITAVVASATSTEETLLEMLAINNRCNFSPTALAFALTEVRKRYPSAWSSSALADLMGIKASEVETYLSLQQAPEEMRRMVDLFVTSGGLEGMSLKAYTDLMQKSETTRQAILEKHAEAVASSPDTLPGVPKKTVLTTASVQRLSRAVNDQKGATRIEMVQDDELPILAKMNEVVSWLMVNPIDPIQRARLMTLVRKIENLTGV